MIFTLIKSSRQLIFLSKSSSFQGTKLSTCFARMSSVTIGTHNGTFHCDEALACFMLKLLPEYKDAKIVRSRDNSILDKCTVVVDVGGKYEPNNNRYDHHMREFKETFDTVINDESYKCDIKLSSAGLVYCHFGTKIIQTVLPNLKDEKILKILFVKVYENFIKEVDAIDNGVQMFDGEPKFYIGSNLSSRVSRLNPAWNDDGKLKPDEQFQKAVALTGEEFVDTILRAHNIWLPARTHVEDAILKRHEVDPSGEIMILATAAPWKEHFFKLETELGVENSIKYVLFEDTTNNTWRIQAVPIDWGSFVCRLYLPEPWRGKRDEELSQIAQIEGCIFVHVNGFIGGNKTKEGTLSMARKALEFEKGNKN